MVRMVQNPAVLLALIGLASLFVHPQLHLTWAQSSQVGTAAAVRGAVEVRSGGIARVPAGGEAMLLGDRVVTQASSGMQVLLLDESVFTIGESNDLVIDRFVYDPDQGVGEIAARSTRGFLRFVSGGVGAVAPQNIAIETPSATIGTRGTSVDVIVGPAAVEIARQLGLIGPNDQVDPTTAMFVVLRGPSSTYNGITGRGRVRVSSLGGQVEIRREGFGVFVPFTGAAPSSPVEVPFDISGSIIASIELPDVGSPQNVGGIDLTELPEIDVTPEDLLPEPGANDFDIGEPCQLDGGRVGGLTQPGGKKHGGFGALLATFELAGSGDPVGGFPSSDPCSDVDTTIIITSPGDT